MEKETGLSKSTIRRSLQSLEKFGYIERLKKRRSVSTGFIRQFNINYLIAFNAHLAGLRLLEQNEKEIEEHNNVVKLDEYSLIDLFEKDGLEVT